ncbi:hypothetical protein [Lewinella sp. LCG006]|uniref:hypothetical protein n=1 Tax=Lewinella sp. LCG006 TaxID=3231911 RepID=UPI003460CA1A
MKYRFAISLCFLSLLFGCQDKPIEKQAYKDQDGVFVEIIDSVGDGKSNPYNADNAIYLPEKEYIFDYRYFTKEGQECRFSREGYDILSVEKLTTTTVTKLSLRAARDNTILDGESDYDQTVMHYDYYLYNDSVSWPREWSGLIENEKNVWMHPWRRTRYFNYLQINPYPFIKKPYEIGNSWGWNLEVGSQWGNPAWATWEGNLAFNHHYEIVGKKEIATDFADKISCYVVEAKGVSRIGETRLTSYFNEEYGFVQFEYLNIDSSRIVINLIEVRDFSKP